MHVTLDLAVSAVTQASNELAFKMEALANDLLKKGIITQAAYNDIIKDARKLTEKTEILQTAIQIKNAVAEAVELEGEAADKLPEAMGVDIGFDKHGAKSTLLIGTRKQVEDLCAVTPESAPDGSGSRCIIVELKTGVTPPAGLMQLIGKPILNLALITGAIASGITLLKTLFSRRKP
jgi:hypothetical protein